MSPVLANLEAFADAAAGRATYPISSTEMLADIAALEAIGKSAVSETIVDVEPVEETRILEAAKAAPKKRVS